ncbi:hypothetical protein PHLGIDRAFT_151690 [Phlebiopsis gigantea 11061_1 CR5-6]|uniref:Uncharacterized protein n=1 Tax=Phlebiopsis gigantea (strain 11061_1 CR5-6) TaxID=745531 RepID=A0A0C3RVN9_PHLG1|nr:hypothetical protein PHLGIDRAFT_151690 [Phlebiopsis gigantea 11061_1 CR5-6]
MYNNINKNHLQVHINGRAVAVKRKIVQDNEHSTEGSRAPGRGTHGSRGCRGGHMTCGKAGAETCPTVSVQWPTTGCGGCREPMDVAGEMR